MRVLCVMRVQCCDESAESTLRGESALNAESAARGGSTMRARRRSVCKKLCVRSALCAELCVVRVLIEVALQCERGGDLCARVVLGAVKLLFNASGDRQNEWLRSRCLAERERIC